MFDIVDYARITGYAEVIRGNADRTITSGLLTTQQASAERRESSEPQLDEQATTRYVITRGVVTMQDPTTLILASLADGDKHGYAIMEDIQVFAGIRLGPGTLYGAICRLEERGWIRPVKSESRRQPYRITTEGSQYLKKQLVLLGQVVRTGNRRVREA